MEMVSAKGIMYNNKNTKFLLTIDERERPVSLQLFGSDPDIISEQAKRIEELPFDILDINMGCPVPKIVNNGDGSALMKNPLLAGRSLKNSPCHPKTGNGQNERDLMRNISMQWKWTHRTGVGGSSHCRSRADQRTVLFRQGRLGRSSER